jgi:hypothetical protein
MIFTSTKRRVTVRPKKQPNGSGNVTNLNEVAIDILP